MLIGRSRSGTDEQQSRVLIFTPGLPSATVDSAARDEPGARSLRSYDSDTGRTSSSQEQDTAAAMGGGCK